MEGATQALGREGKVGNPEPWKGWEGITQDPKGREMGGWVTQDYERGGTEWTNVGTGGGGSSGSGRS